jgi:hypothetical protein
MATTKKKTARKGPTGNKRTTTSKKSVTSNRNSLAKVETRPVRNQKKVNGKEQVTLTRNDFTKIIENVTTMSRSSLFVDTFLNRGIDINHECRYPDVISMKEYKELYMRNGTANRVVKLWPEESWAMDPDVIENEDSTETEFEKKWKEVQIESRVFHYLKRIDILSGIGEFGILLIGIDDGLELVEPVDGINEKTGEKIGKGVERKIIYLKPFDQSVVTIDKKELDPTSPRFGMPVIYGIKFTNESSADVIAVKTSNELKIHWTRVLHIADNRESSETYGVPRMQSVFNRVLDIRKILGGSGEMFWKGAFQGLSFETQADAEGGTLDIESLKDQMEKYGNGMQRYLATEGLTVKTLQPTLSSPKEHIEANKRDIAIAMGVPYRIFLGTEEAKLASSQDVKTMNKRIASRQTNYVSPYVIRAFIDKLIAMGVLPEAIYLITWPDLNTPTDLDIAEVADKITSALAKYVAAGVNTMVAEKEYLTMILKMTDEEAETILNNAIGLQNLDDTDPIDDDDIDPDEDDNDDD